MKKLFWILYVIGCVIVLSSAVNVGLFLYIGAIPFMVLILWISKSKVSNKKLFYVSIFLIIFTIVVSHTQTKNPILFPIISDGYIEVLENGYLRTFSDGSGGFSLENKQDIGGIGFGEIKYTKITKSERYKVLGVKISHPDFGTEIGLITEIGVFSETDYDPYPTDVFVKSIEVNKPVRAWWAHWVSIGVFLPFVIFVYLLECLKIMILLQ